MDHLKTFIREIPDYPKPGILYYDLTTLLQDGKGFHSLVDKLCDHYSAGDPGAFVLSRQMGAAWASFARTGNPNHSGLPHWPTYNADNRATMYFDTPCEVRNNPEGNGLRIITNRPK